MSTPHLIVPIYVGTELKCCVPDLMRTDAVLTGAANEMAENEWEVYESNGPDVTGSVTFGICCANQVVITLEGQVETLDSGYDTIRVLHNDNEVFFFQSTTDEQDDADKTVAAGPFTVTINLEDRACGHIIEISGGTGDDRANNGVYWNATVSIT
jgi:hypothetical protein